MTCTYCGTHNGASEHRCRRCGRRPGDTLTPNFTVPRANVAVAPKLEPVPYAHRSERPKLRIAPNLARAVQGSLFQDQTEGPALSPALEHLATKVIAFESLVAGSAAGSVRTPGSSGVRAPSKPLVGSGPRVPKGQSSLEFLPPEPLQPRKLGTTVDAVIYCEAPVATPLHRAVAAALDWSMVLIGYGLFLLAFHAAGGEFLLNKTDLLALGGMLPLIGFTYGLFWTIVGTESPGMRWTELRLTTFEGLPLEGRHRALRFLGSCLSLCTVVGLLWSLADEECLNWPDHISRTFPTPRGLDSQVFRRR